MKYDNYKKASFVSDIVKFGVCTYDKGRTKSTTTG